MNGVINRRGAVFFDRDGTLIKDKSYIFQPDQIEIYRTVPNALRLLRKGGFRLVMLTNQSGIGRGYFTLGDLEKVHRKFISILAHKGVKLDGIYFCPHPPSRYCDCRKPRSGLLRQAVRRLFIDVKRSYVVGDKKSDIDLGKRNGARTVLLLSGKGRKERRKVKPHVISRDLLSAAKWIIRDSKGR